MFAGARVASIDVVEDIGSSYSSCDRWMLGYDLEVELSDDAGLWIL